MPPPVPFRGRLVYDFEGYLRSGSRFGEQVAVEGFRRWPLLLGFAARPIGHERAPGVVVVDEQLMRLHDVQRHDALRDPATLQRWYCHWSEAFRQTWCLTRRIEANPAPALPTVLSSYLRGLIALQGFGYAKSNWELPLVLGTILDAWSIHLRPSELDHVTMSLSRSPVVPHFVRLRRGLLDLALLAARKGHISARDIDRFIYRFGFIASEGFELGPMESPRQVREQVRQLLHGSYTVSFHQLMDERHLLTKRHLESLAERRQVWRYLRHRLRSRFSDTSAAVTWRHTEAFVDCFVGEEELRRWLLLRAMRNVRREASARGIPLTDVTLERLRN